MKKILLRIVTVVLIVTGCLVVVLIIVGRDISPPDTTDLTPERHDLPSEQNAYTYFLEATNSFYWPTNSSLVIDYLDGKPADDTVIQETISRNTTTIQAIKRGLECETCQTPEVTGFDTLLPYVSPWMKMGKVMALMTRYDRLAGRHADATSTCISLLRFANMMQKDAGSIINYLVGIGVLDLGLTQAQDLARDKGTPQDELTRLSGALADLGEFDRGLIRAVKVEYRVVANYIDQFRMDELDGIGIGKLSPMMKGKRIPGYIFQPNKTKLTFANLYRDMIKNAPLPYANMNRYDVEEVLGLNGSRVKLITRPNAVGRILYGLLLPALDSLLERRCRVECGVVAARLLVACNAYQRRESAWPDSLQSLVPAYLAAVPADPYDGKPFRFAPSLGIIYSVGKDLKDSGGSSMLPKGIQEDSPSKRRWKAEDIVFEIKASDP